MAKRIMTETHFRGILTPDLREFIRHRRRTLGVTLQQLSSVLRVNWSTLRKWEDGSVGRCQHSHIYRLSKFLAGDYDEELRRMSSPVDPLQPRFHGRSSPMLAWMERAATLFKFCENHSSIRAEMVRKIESAVDKEVLKLMQKSTGASGMSELYVSHEQEVGK